MKKSLLFKLGILLFAIFLIGSSYINYRVYKSFNDQTVLIYEFNAYQNKVPLSIIESYNDEIPNITVTTLPLKMLKARYYMRDSLEDLALPLLYQSKKDNPFLGISDFELAKYHYKKNNIDSAEYYSKNAFNALPKNILLSRQYFQILTKQKKDFELDIAFKKIKNYYIIEQWKDYLFSKINIGKTPQKKLVQILTEAEKFIADKSQFSTLQTILKVGVENLDDLGKIIIQAESAYNQGKFVEAANLYEKAASMDDSEYTHFENAALSFYRGDIFNQAESLFRYVLNTFNVKNGKSELYLGLLLYEKKEVENACKFWKISLQKGFSGAEDVIKTFCK